MAAALLAVPAAATHGSLTTPVWFQWRFITVGSTPTIDILIVPPHHSQLVNGNGVLPGNKVDEANICTNAYMDGTRDAIEGWRDAVATWAPAWLDDLVINTWELGPAALGCGPTPPVGTEIEILVTSDETKGVILGQAVHTFAHPCLVENSMWFLLSFTYRDYRNVAGHEIGHCLGLNHTTGQPSGCSATETDEACHDILEATYHHSIGNFDTHLHCQSNANVGGMQGVYALEFGEDPSTWGVAVSVAHASYDQLSCNPGGRPVTYCWGAGLQDS